MEDNDQYDQLQGESYQFTESQLELLTQAKSESNNLETIITTILNNTHAKNLYIKTDPNESIISFVNDGQGERRDVDVTKFLYLFSVVDFIEIYSKCANEKLFCLSTVGETEYNIYDIETPDDNIDEPNQESGTNLTVHVKLDLFNDFIKALEIMCKQCETCMIYIDGHLTNRKQMLWLRNKEDIPDKDYKLLYKTISNDKYEPYTYTHFTIEGNYNFSVILYIPYQPPEYVVKLKNTVNKIHLYCNHEFVSNTCDELVPEYLNFVIGIIDTDNQSPKGFSVIRKQICKKILEMIQSLVSDTELYNVFYVNYAKYLKLGIHDDPDNREKLIQLLRYHSTFSIENSKNKDNDNDKKLTIFTDLDSYISRAGDNKNIYYISGDSLTNLSTSTHLEIFKKNNIEVIFMDEPMDEYCLLAMTEYKGYQFVNITRNNVNIGSEEDNNEEFVNTCNRIKDILGNYVSNVCVTNRLVESPCCVTIGNGWTSNMEKIMKSKAQSDPTLMSKMSTEKYFNLNPNNVLIKKIQEIVEAGQDKTTGFESLIVLLYETALQDAGFPVMSSKLYSQRVYSMMHHGLGI